MGMPTIDLYMVHALEDPGISLDEGGEWKRVKDRLVREKKIRFMGFSTHVEMSARSACLRNAVKGGWVDALMAACDPGLVRANAEFNEAIGACAEAGIGLVCMKTTRGLGRGADQPEQAREAFAKLGLTPHQAMQAGMWSDGRFASVCSEMANRRIMEENAAGVRKFTKPFDEEQRRILEEGMRGLARATCPGCDGSCRRAAGTATDFCTIARCLDYYEHDGNRDTARRLYAELRPEQRDARGADLTAASAACPAHLDFAAILRKAERHLA
jgi:predicted aldo/keto reductase-like oxidoreductase